MEAEKKTRLEGRAWKVGSAEAFLQLTPEEAALVELRLRLADVDRCKGSSTLRRGETG